MLRLLQPKTICVIFNNDNKLQHEEPHLFCTQSQCEGSSNAEGKEQQG